MTSTTEAKEALRGRVLEARRRFDAADLVHIGRRLRDVLLGVPEIINARRVAAYASVGREPGTGPLLEALADRDIEVLLPVLMGDLGLDWSRYSGPASLVAAPRGLLEPVGPRLGPEAVLTADAVLVPGLAVDRKGTRLGRGAGSYDRVLATLPEAFTCVLLHEGEILDLPIPQEPHDVPVSGAATVAGLVRFS